ncbi:hypothetical protein [Mesorhizobium sp.]|uniref:hypothetical protein n=1 Tax=Mesorhizobium sp. TaxID=1871066 RepID=UPI000FE483FF|nr:hypothetical protein [Mesorhizobium sp.]RWE86945.1 MAG: hypothetical protein EOS49_11825 [Mesorhizobium sp.]
MIPHAISHHTNALGQGADRIRATLNTTDYPVPTLVEATKISPVIIDRFRAGGLVSDEQLDMIAGFLKGEYALDGIGHEWVRRKMGRPEVEKLGTVYPDLPVGPVVGVPIAVPERVPQDALPTLVDPRLATSPPVEPRGMFGSRRSA